MKAGWESIFHSIALKKKKFLNPLNLLCIKIIKKKQQLPSERKMVKSQLKHKLIQL